ncbi:hypothetical protein NFJ02_14g16070 [Pycnococcus provasolii]
MTSSKSAWLSSPSAGHWVTRHAEQLETDALQRAITETHKGSEFLDIVRGAITDAFIQRFMEAGCAHNTDSILHALDELSGDIGTKAQIFIMRELAILDLKLG